MDQATIAYDTHFDFGSGVDSSTERLRGVAVVQTEPKVLPNAGGADVIYNIELVDSQRQLQQSMGVSAAASVSYGGFMGSASARVDFTENHALDQHSIALMVKVQVSQPPLILRNPQLTSEAKALYARSPEQFKARFGDMFVSGVLSGGQLYGMIRISSNSETTKEELKVALSAKGVLGAFSGSASVDIDKKVSEVTNNMRTTVFVHSSGYVPDTYHTTVDGLMKLAAEFPAKVSGRSVPFALDLMSYDLLDHPPGPNLFDIENRAEFIADCAKMKSVALSLRASVRIMRAQPWLYPSITPQKMQTDEESLNEFLDLLARRVSACFNDYTACQRGGLTLPTISVPDPVQLPSSPVQTKFQQLGELTNSTVGLPLPPPLDKEVTTGDDSRGRKQYYQSGAIYFHPDTGAFAVYGSIFQKYKEIGEQNSNLGFPTSDEHSVGLSGDRRSYFRNGSIVWKRSLRQCVVTIELLKLLKTIKTSNVTFPAPNRRAVVRVG